MPKSPQNNNRATLDKGRLKAAYNAQLPAYEAALQKLQQSIRQLFEQHNFTPTIKYRVKRFEPYYEKIRKISALNQQANSDAISDFLGLRIICPFLADVEIVEQILLDNCQILEVERKATQHSFREFGYDSVHLQADLPLEGIDVSMPGTRPSCEIQLRTILQDAWAEVEHELVYKSDIDLPNESIRRKLASLNATLTLSDLIFQEIRDFQQELRHRGRKRRESLNRNREINSEHLAVEMAPTEKTFNTLRLGPMPKSLTSELETLMLQALEAHSNQDFQTAITLYSKLLGLKLKKKIRSLVYNHRGMAFFALGQTRQAFKDFCKAVSYEPDNLRGYVNRGLCNRILNQFENALADFDKALEIDGDHEESFYGRAQCYYEMGLYDQALNDCQALLKRSPEDQPAKHLRELIHRAML